LSVAGLANLNTALVAAGWDGWPLSPAAWAAVMLVAALLVALVVDVLFLDPVVAFVVSWAAAAIAAEHWQDSTLVAIVATLVSIKALFLAGRVLLFGALPMPRIDRDAIERSLRFGPRTPHRS